MEKEKTQLKVAVLTPYLYESLAELAEDARDAMDFIKQITVYGFHPDNLSGVNAIETENYHVTVKNFRDLQEQGPGVLLTSDFAIAGSTRDMEDLLGAIKDKGVGLIVARYSIFYGGPSGYTGVKPEDGGYAIDIPKTPNAAKILLTSESFLEGIAERSAPKIRAALAEVSEGKGTPIVATPYLDKICGGE